MTDSVNEQMPDKTDRARTMPVKPIFDVWLDAAYQTLITEGVENVKVQILSKKLRLARSSFYRAFKDRATLLEALLDRWRDKNTGGIIRQCGAYSETLEEAILNIFDCWLDPTIFDAEFEYAIRGWALQSPSLIKELGQTDELRIEAINEVFRRFGIEPEMADVSARALYQGQIGYISMGTKETIEQRVQRMPPYVRLFSGRLPRRREMERFLSRHNIPREYVSDFFGLTDGRG